MSVYKLKQVWSIQLIILTLTAIAFFSFFYYDAYIKTENQYCVGKPFSLWTNNVIALIASATGGHAISQLFRIVAANVGFRYDQQPRHPYAGIIMFFVTVFMTGSQGSVYFGILERTCIDGYGTPFSPHIWIDWIATVPYCFFLVSMMDLDRNEMSLTDLLVQGSGTSAVVALFLTMFTENLLLINTLFIFANFAMTFALGYQQFDSYVSFKTSCDNYERSVEQDLEDHVCSHLRYLVTIAQSKLNCATFLSISFSLFPVAYYLRLIGIIDDDIWHISIVLLNYLSKCLFAILTTDCHIEMLDSSRVLLMEEKKRSEESRMMFLRYVFHEVRVPLNSVSLGVQLLNDSDTISDSDKETVHTIREAIQFMSETLNDVLSIQKIEQGMLQLELKPFRHDDLIRAVLSNFRAQCATKGIIVKSIVNDNVPPAVIGDQFRLEHVLGNFVSNAIKFSKRGGEIKIVVSYETKTKGNVTYAVIDQGPGIAESDQRGLFQPFVQIRPGELQKGRGSGLGLSICKNIITIHNGTVGVNSKQRHSNGDITTGGSEFYFSIPFELPTSNALLEIDKSPSMESFDSSDSLTIIDPNSKKKNRNLIDAPDYIPVDANQNQAFRNHMQEELILMGKFPPIGKILICDDVLSNRKMLGLILQKKNQVCEQCFDGQNAIELVIEQGIDHFDLIFMDSIMPRMTGPDTTSKLRKMGYSHYIVGVTGNAMDIDIATFEAAGADAVLTKPVRMDELMLVLKYVLKNGNKSAIGTDIPPEKRLKAALKGQK